MAPQSAVGRVADRAIPAEPRCQVFHHQMVPFEFDAASSIIAITSTNAVSLTIGSF